MPKLKASSEAGGSGSGTEKVAKSSRTDGGAKAMETEEMGKEASSDRDDELVAEEEEDAPTQVSSLPFFSVIPRFPSLPTSLSLWIAHFL